MSDLKNKAIGGMMWATFERIGTQVVTFIIGIILARLLTPSDYGIIGLLVVFTSISSVFVDSGFSSALIQKGKCTQIEYSTVFFFNVTIGILCYVVCYIAAPFIASFYNVPELKEISRVLFLVIILNSIIAVQTTKLRIELNFKLQSKITIISSVLTGIIAIIAAYRGFGIWALVIQSLTYALLTIICFYIATRWRPSLVFSWSSFRGMLKFGSNLLAANLLGTIFENLYQLTIGKFCKAIDVGLYNRAFHFVQLPTLTLTDILIKVNFPLLSQFKEDDEKLKSVYERLLRTPMFILYPILFIMAALSKPLILVVLGEKWLECSLLLSILAFGCLWQPLAGINVYLLYVKGRSDTALKLDFIKKPIMITILLTSIPFGLKWICVGRALYSLLAFIINCHYTGKLLNYGFIRQMKNLIPLLFYGIAAFSSALLVMLFFHSPLIQLILGSAVGTTSYFLLSFFFKEQSLVEISTIVKTKVFHRK